LGKKKPDFLKRRAGVNARKAEGKNKKNAGTHLPPGTGWGESVNGDHMKNISIFSKEK